MTLYNITAKLEQAYYDSIDPETGEILDSTEFDSLQMAKEDKVDQIGCLIKNLNAEAAAIKAEKDALAKRQRSAENNAEKLKRYLADNLQGESFKSARVAISWRRSESVEIADLAFVPTEFLKFKDPEPDKTALKKAIKAGQEFEGVALVEHQNIQIK